MAQGASLNAQSQPVYLTDSQGVAQLIGANTLYEDQRVFDGFGYSVSSAVVAVSTNNYLIVELANPAGSGVNFVMSSRVLSSNITSGNAPLEYARYASTAVLNATPAPTPVTVNNRIAGGAPTTATFRYQMGPTLPTGVVTSQGFVPTGGEEKRIKDIVIIPPGGKLIYALGGSGGGLAAAARIAVTFLYYTRVI